jgi:glycosyltransferase involved in cell wall biosynthesis
MSSGWSVKAFNHIAKDVRASNGKVILMFDVNYRFSFKECLKALRFRLFLSKRFDAVFVPGKGSVELMRFYGVAKDKIITGVYAADSTLFTNGGELAKRPKKMVYVGRLCKRKNVRGLCKAFVKAGGPEKGWNLEIYGCGEDRDMLHKYNPAVKIHDFLQPEELAKVYQNARCFVLPSFEEPWGLVVHEAALSGCVLLLSDRVGAVKDLLGEGNGFTFNPYSLKSFVCAMRKVFELDDNALSKAQSVSLSLSKTKSLKTFVDGVKAIVSGI